MAVAQSGWCLCLTIAFNLISIFEGVNIFAIQMIILCLHNYVCLVDHPHRTPKCQLVQRVYYLKEEK